MRTTEGNGGYCQDPGARERKIQGDGRNPGGESVGSEVAREERTPLPPFEYMGNIIGTTSELHTYVLSLLTVLQCLLQDGLCGDDFTDGLAESVGHRMFTLYTMQSHAGSYIAVRKALDPAGMNCSPAHLNVIRNFPDI